MVITEPSQTIFAPAVSPGAGMVMRKKVPRGAVGTVVFAHRTPLAFGKVRPPPPPVRRAFLGLLESHGFLCHRCHVLLPLSDCASEDLRSSCPLVGCHCGTKDAGADSRRRATALHLLGTHDI